MTGAAGLDRFVFNTALNATTNKDTITDYSLVEDRIFLENTGAACSTLSLPAISPPRHSQRTPRASPLLRRTASSTTPQPAIYSTTAMAMAAAAL